MASFKDNVYSGTVQYSRVVTNTLQHVQIICIGLQSSDHHHQQHINSQLYTDQILSYHPTSSVKTLKASHFQSRLM